MNEATLEVTLRLQGGMKEDETMAPAGPTEESNTRRKHNSVTTQSTSKGR